MRRQKGGAVRYEVPPSLNTPEKVLALIRERAVNLPIPSQTIGTCALDSIISGLLYPSDVSDSMWRYIFGHYVAREGPERSAIIVPNEYISLAVLRTLPQEERVNRQVDAFLATAGARVLRILSNIDGSSRALRRELSFASSPEMHGSSPSILCSTLAAALGRREDEAHRVYEAVEPGATPDIDKLALDKTETDIALRKVLLRVQDPGLGIQSNEAPIPGSRKIVAVFASMFGLDDSDWYTRARRVEVSHGIVLVRIRGVWYVADDNFGRLLKLNSGRPLDNRDIQNSFLDFSFSKIAEEDRASYNIPPEAYPMICQYKLISALDWKKVIASTDETFKIRTPGDEAQFERWSSYPVGTSGGTRELHGIADGYPLHPRAMYEYYRTLETDEDELRSDQGDTPEVQQFDTQRGRAFLLERNVSERDFSGDMNAVRRIGKNIVRDLGAPIKPYAPRGSNRIYLTALPSSPAGGKRYSRRLKQWGSKRGVASSTRRRGSQRPNWSKAR